jgi:hypothetical protein
MQIICNKTIFFQNAFSYINQSVMHVKVILGMLSPPQSSNRRDSVSLHYTTSDQALKVSVDATIV